MSDLCCGTLQGRCRDALHAHLPHAVVCAFDRTGQGDCPAQVFDDDALEAELRSIHRGEPDAKVIREAAQKHAAKLPLAQVAGEPGRREVVIFEKRRIAVDLFAKTFAEQELGVRDVHRELRAAGALHAMVGPEMLRSLWRFGGVNERLLAWVRAGKRNVTLRVPVLRADHVREARRQRLDAGDDFISTLDAKRAPGEEVMLHVDDEERVVWAGGFHDAVYSTYHAVASAEAGGGAMKRIAAGVLLVMMLSARAQEKTISPARPIPPGGAPHMESKLIGMAPAQYAIVFYKGDEVLSGLTDWAIKNKVKTAHFTGIGAVSSATVAWLDLSKKLYREIDVPEQVEVLSLTGDIAEFNGKPVVHMHAVMGRLDGSTVGGHVWELNANPTIEVFVTQAERTVHKLPDDASGMKLIHPEQAH